MHNNNIYQCKMCWKKALTFGVGLIQLSFRTIVFTQYMQRCFQSKCYYISVKLRDGLHLSAFHIDIYRNETVVYTSMLLCVLYKAITVCINLYRKCFVLHNKLLSRVCAWTYVLTCACCVPHPLLPLYMYMYMY